MAILLYNCKHCKAGRRVEYPVEPVRGYFYRVAPDGKRIPAGVWIDACGGGRPTVYGGDVEMGLCPKCKRAMTFGALKGRLVPEHKCDARCLASRGPNCECSCGGANHGKSWAA